MNSHMLLWQVFQKQRRLLFASLPSTRDTPERPRVVRRDDRRADVARLMERRRRAAEDLDEERRRGR